MTALHEEIRDALNRASAENGSDTPDAILAGYLLGCLETFNAATRARDSWYGFRPWDPLLALVGVVCPECRSGKHPNCTETVLGVDDLSRPCACKGIGHVAA